MQKFNQKVHDIALAVGGSHYPSVNPELHKQMVKAVLEECMSAIDSADHSHVHTTFDKDQYLSAIEKIKQSINKRFGL